jgi:hypothetical protein
MPDSDFRRMSHVSRFRFCSSSLSVGLVALWRTLAVSLLAMLVVSCAKDPMVVDDEMYEQPLAEAVFRKLLEDVPDFPDGSPKVYALVTRDNARACEPTFVKRFVDTGKKFADARYLRVREDLHPVDPETGLSPVTLQVRLIEPAGPNTFRVHTGWAYKGDFERRTYVVTPGPDLTATVTLESVLEQGHWNPGDPKPGTVTNQP